ncbi:putative RNA-dependent RNA polymerase [Magnaporthe oryzae polymycovirus 1]|uniref:Putative RNA-dependent RNA polymerase n=1 Tax=Magnaporthe oryzae polymycovirus 1 TaxID=2509266 RepID=A0A410TEM4_9VIRU|nr:ORF1a [Magnaporthe oryzae polymycovirus 1]QAU09249.1 putative RNA-dependent RNA polymerase [Magnaporthe oryzae polymycovirus 1]
MSSSLYDSASEPLTAVVVERPSPGVAQVIADVPSLLQTAIDVCLRSGLHRGSCDVVVTVGPQCVRQVFSAQRVPGRTPPHIATPHARAAAFRLDGNTEAEKLASLRAYDEPRPKPRGYKTPFYRSSARLNELAEAIGRMRNPSVRISQYQLPSAMSFGGGPTTPERPLRAPLLAAIDATQRRHPNIGYAQRVGGAAELGDYTTHDPDSLHPRFLNYVKERITSVDERTTRAMDTAVDLQTTVWRDQGISVDARPLSDAEPAVLSTMVNRGSPGEYRMFGVTDRRDPRLVKLMSDSILRYGAAGRRVAAGKRPPPWVATTIQPTLTFGKEEPKAAKLENGVRVPPVPRFIFNLSPANYGPAAFLHSDLSHELQEKDFTHGPGFGPGRGRSGKFLDIVNRSFGAGVSVPGDERLVMSDIDKWDGNVREALGYPTYDALESAVNKSHLPADEAAARSLLSGVARRQLMEKLVEHPSGYLLDMYGSMPSGSYYTSLVNTNANNLLILGHIVDRAANETEYTCAGAAEVLRHNLKGRLASYGDNQLFSEYLFKILGMRYDPAKHAEYLARYGMKLKIDETEVTDSIARVRFCSRAVVMTPHGPLITRTHSSIAAKLAARPEHDPVVDKLYVRALMADTMGTDPLLFEIMSRVDRSIDVPISLETITPRVKPVLASAAKTLFGSDADEYMLSVLHDLSTTIIDRRALLSLHTPAGAATKREMRTGTSLGVGVSLFGGPLTPAATWALSLTPDAWVAYLTETGQLEVMYDKSD